MSWIDALEADRAEHYERAAGLYEACLTHDSPSLRVLVDLAGLYWQVTDPGLAAAQNFSAEFMSRAARRSRELLDQAVRTHPRSTEALFWRRFIAWADWGGPQLHEDECRAMLAADPAVLAPAMLIYGRTEGRECEREVRFLVAEARRRNTTLDRYVISYSHIVEEIVTE